MVTDERDKESITYIIIIYGIIRFNLVSLYITKIRKYVGSRALRPTFSYKFAE